MAPSIPRHDAARRRPWAPRAGPRTSRPPARRPAPPSAARLSGEVTEIPDDVERGEMVAARLPIAQHRAVLRRRVVARLHGRNGEAVALTGITAPGGCLRSGERQHGNGGYWARGGERPSARERLADAVVDRDDRAGDQPGPGERGEVARRPHPLASRTAGPRAHPGRAWPGRSRVPSTPAPGRAHISASPPGTRPQPRARAHRNGSHTARRRAGGSPEAPRRA